MGILPQPYLINTVNIKSINGDSVLGPGNLVVSPDSFEHVQSSASSTWTINHNLGRYPSSVSIQNIFRIQCLAKVSYTSINQIVVTFAEPQTGYVYIN